MNTIISKLHRKFPKIMFNLVFGKTHLIIKQFYKNDIENGNPNNKNCIFYISTFPSVEAVIGKYISIMNCESFAIITNK